LLFYVLRHIAELIFYMEELRAHVRKYGPVMQRYYVQYLSGFDAVVLNELVQVRLLSGANIGLPPKWHPIPYIAILLTMVPRAPGKNSLPM
jgi:hypothetical protein